jgi:hypothetical protein
MLRLAARPVFKPSRRAPVLTVATVAVALAATLMVAFPALMTWEAAPKPELPVAAPAIKAPLPVVQASAASPAPTPATCSEAASALGLCGAPALPAVSTPSQEPSR